MLERVPPNDDDDLDIPPELWAEAEKAAIAFMEALYNAEQAVADGRHPDLASAMRAMGYDSSEELEIAEEDDDGEWELLN